MNCVTDEDQIGCHLAVDRVSDSRQNGSAKCADATSLETLTWQVQ